VPSLDSYNENAVPTYLKHLFNEPFVRKVASVFKQLLPAFPDAEFCTIVLGSLDGLELKDRQRLISTNIVLGLQGLGIKESIDVLVKAAPELTGYPGVVVPDCIAAIGLSHPDDALVALRDVTAYSTSEFAVRPFLAAYPELTIARLQSWVGHPNEHVRRWCSEGLRPNLPWGGVHRPFVLDPWPLMEVYEALKDDSSEYVRRSVANSINDVSKAKPDIVVALLKRWMKENPSRKKLVQHAARTLIRKGNQEILKLFGQSVNPNLSVPHCRCTPDTLAIGASTLLVATIANGSAEEAMLRLQYRITYVKPSGLNFQKVFSWKQTSVPFGQTVFSRNIRFQHYSTRTQHPGVHIIDILVNGIVCNSTTVNVTT
jgi:3-methyladenine DNA glycosylase AlkC